MGKGDLDTIWRVSDALWGRMSMVLAVYDPPSRTGRPRVDQRRAMDALAYRLRTGCQWNHLPAEFDWGMSVYRTFRRWEQKGTFDILWALLLIECELIECEELGGVDRHWQAADGCLGRARGVPKKAARRTPPSAPGRTPATAPGRASRGACLSRPGAARLRSASPGPTSPT